MVLGLPEVGQLLMGEKISTGLWFIRFNLKLIFIALLGLGTEFTAVSCSVKDIARGLCSYREQGSRHGDFTIC